MVDRVLDPLVLEIAEGRFREGASMTAVRAFAAKAGAPRRVGARLELTAVIDER
jgi:hypothetical protein